MIIEKKKISDLIPAPYNPRQSTAKQEQHLKESLEKFGLVEPIIYNKQTGYIVGGHFRVRELKKLGIKEVECVIVDLNEQDEKELNIRLNANTGGWDWDTLANDWEVEDLEAWGLEIPQFETIEEIEAEEDDYEVPDGGIETDIVIGDLFEIGEHRLLCGDSTDSEAVARLMNGEKADMVFTDPPYGVSYEGGHNKKKRQGIENDTLGGTDLTNLFRDSLLNADLFSKDHSAFYIWFSTNKAKETFLSFSELNLEVRAILCWYKVKSGLGAFMAQYIPNFEPCIYAFKKGCKPQWFGASDEKSVWELKKDQKNDYHPTQKPIELPERAIRNSSKAKDLVLDVFLGSGSTMVAAHQLKRRCYGLELEPKYCAVIIDRMRKLDSSLIIKRNGIQI
jgi:DNA modification methylase